MDPLGQVANAILQRCPAPALALDELHDALRQEARELVPPRDHVLHALEGQPGIRILRRPPCRGEMEIGPAAWVLATESDRRPERPIRSLPERLRQSLIALGAVVEPESMREWVRWNRMLMEEGRIRDALRRSRERARPAAPPQPVPPPSTTRRTRRRRSRRASVNR